MTKPATKDIEVYQGDTFDLYFRVKSRQAGVMDYLDLTGATVAAQVRATPSASATLASFTCTLDNQTTSKGGVLCSIPKEVTAGLTATNAVWDCEITFADGDRKTVLAGKVTITPEVTRVP